jgi:uncharacterized protein with HEPN domain
MIFEKLLRRDAPPRNHIPGASRQLPAFKARLPNGSWKDVAGSGNIYRHNYEDVLERRVWQTIHEALPPLLALVDAELHK